ncbi:MAG: hypothetical protein IPH13_11080 [Planctomycetes bacterium]|nr:hypothetical protein [Planctomycetota bacterium]
MSAGAVGRSRAGKAAIGIGVAVAIVAALEGLFRLVGIGAVPPGIDVERGSDGTMRVRIEAPASSVQGEAAFLADKPDDVFRIVFVGASTTKGVPYSHVSSYALFTVARIAWQLPALKLEYVNLGAPTESMRTTLHVARIALEAEADLLVLEAGHNEFLENSLAAHASPFSGLVRALDDVHVVRLLGRALRADPDATVARREGALGAPRDVPSQIGEDGLEFRTRVEDRFAVDVDTLLVEARARGVPVCVVLPPADVSDFLPEAAFEPGVLRGDEAETNAVTVFRRASGARANGSVDAAAALFQRARDLDPRPGGITPRLIERLRESARNHGAIVADAYSAFVDASPDGLVGLPLLVDHCHPSLRGQYVMAGVVVAALRDAGMLAPREQWDVAKDPQFEALLGALRIDPRYAACAEADAAMADIAYALVSHDPSFYADRCARRLERSLATLPSPAEGRVALALAYVLTGDERGAPLLTATLRTDGSAAREFLQIMVDASPRVRRALERTKVALDELGIRVPLLVPRRG